MKAPESTDDFLALVGQSGLARAAALPPHLSGRAGDVAGDLVRAGVLTSFQAKQLLRGRWKGFFRGRYRLLELLGGGGTGWVYLAQEEATAHVVALKTVAGSGQEPQRLASFWREASALVQVSHPNVVQLLDVCSSGGTPFLVQEYIDGTDLNGLVARGGPTALARVARWGLLAAEGLGYLHGCGLIHGDVKPANLALDRSGAVKLLDLGSSRPIGQAGAAGTAGYLPPEQAEGLPLDAHADGYGLGASLAFLLTGHPGTERLDEVRLPDEVQDLLRRLLGRRARDRAPLEEVKAVLAPWSARSAPPRPDELPALCPAIARLLRHGGSAMPVAAGAAPVPGVGWPAFMPPLCQP